MTKSTVTSEPLLSPGEAAGLLGTEGTKALVRLAARAGLTVIFTPGGHRRYREAEVRAFKAASSRGPAGASAPNGAHAVSGDAAPLKTAPSAAIGTEWTEADEWADLP
jgi:hypothetical protein